jgi:hypothetical protein
MQELPIIQKTYDLIKWYIPILNRLPRDHRFALGDRMVKGLYDLLEGLIQARYAGSIPIFEKYVCHSERNEVERTILSRELGFRCFISLSLHSA